MKMSLNRSWWSILLVCLLPLLVAGCPSGDKDLCEENSCNGHGTCEDSSGEIVCACDSGYVGSTCADCDSGLQDKDGNGSCTAACDVDDAFCSHHGSCSDSSGTAVCDCDDGYGADDCGDCAEGYQDNDADGSCLATCASLDWNCGGHGSCADDSGEAVCVCDAGYQDNDADGTCAATCATAALACGDHGDCADDTGAAICACDEGWGGDVCDECADGWQDNDGDGVCAPGCASGIIDCGDYGNCNDASGDLECRCVTGHTGELCDECADMYQDNDGDGACAPGCDLYGGSCGAYGHCDDSSGTPACVCDAGHVGDDCATCDAGYQDNDGDGYCAPDCAAAALSCGSHGACSDSSGLAHCACDDGYAGDSCEMCAIGFQDNDGDGECASDCAHAGLACGSHATCTDASGVAVCVCDEGYVGATCDTCDAGYQDLDSNGTCLPDCATLAWDCSNHGQCDHADGTADCVCDAGYTGDQCQQCDLDYQDNDGDGVCSAACSGAGLVCGANAHCEDSSGTAGCICDSGYEGANCDTCATGYQDSDSNGSCLPTCEFLAWVCSGHGSCTYASGEAVCACENGYVDDGLGNCMLIGAGESCLAPLLLDLSLPSVTGSTVGMINDESASCVGSDSEEVVYVFSVVQPLSVTFETEGFDTVMHLRSTCDDPGTELDCNDDGGPGTGSRLTLDLTAGTYYLFVDGYGSNTGTYTLTIDIACGVGFIYDPVAGDCVDNPCLPNPCADLNKTVCTPDLPGFVCSCDPGYIPDPNDPPSCIPDPNPYGEACADAMPLDASLGDHLVSGLTSDATDDGAGTCGGNGPDRVYGFVIDQVLRAEFNMTGFDTVLHLRTVCDNQASQVVCDDDGGEGTNSQFVAFLDPGTYYVWADSYGDAGGSYDLDYSLRADPCIDDPCPGTPECVASADWSSYECVCPAGTLPFGGDCVDDPCDPNLCTEDHKSRCVPELPGNYLCECNIGYIPDPNDPPTCIMDPDANEWAFIVFLNADNNLDSFGVEDVAEMGQAGSTPYVHVVALFDRVAGPATVIYVTPGGYDTIADWGEVDMGDWQMFRDFGIWAVENYPARHYAYIAWDHGAGWKRPQESPITKGFSNDDHGSGAGISISNGDYAAAMAGITAALGGKLDIIGFDACLMGMYEVASASSDYADYLLASEELEPGRGWPYHGFLPGLIANWEMSALELASSVVDAFYNEASDDDTLSVIDLNTMDDLDAALSTFADELRANSNMYGQIDSVRSDTQTFGTSTHRDLQDFAERIAVMAGAPAALVDAANALVAQCQVTIAYNRTQSGYLDAEGMAIYFCSQGSGMDAAYVDAGAVWSQRATWDDFLADFCN